MNDMSAPMAELDALIARLEAAEGSRELDAQIAALCAPTDDPRMASFENGRDYPDRYTTSLDAALTLVPDGMSTMLDIDPERSICTVHGRTGLVEQAGAEARTAPLAVAAAALKARMSLAHK